LILLFFFRENWNFVDGARKFGQIFLTAFARDEVKLSLPLIAGLIIHHNYQTVLRRTQRYRQFMPVSNCEIISAIYLSQKELSAEEERGENIFPR